MIYYMGTCAFFEDIISDLFIRNRRDFLSVGILFQLILDFQGLVRCVIRSTYLGVFVGRERRCFKFVFDGV